MWCTIDGFILRFDTNFLWGKIFLCINWCLKDVVTHAATRGQSSSIGPLTWLEAFFLRGFTKACFFISLFPCLTDNETLNYLCGTLSILGTGSKVWCLKRFKMWTFVSYFFFFFASALSTSALKVAFNFFQFYWYFDWFLFVQLTVLLSILCDRCFLWYIFL